MARCWPLRAGTTWISVVQTEVSTCRANPSPTSKREGTCKPDFVTASTPRPPAPGSARARLAGSRRTPACRHSAAPSVGRTVPDRLGEAWEPVLLPILENDPAAQAVTLRAISR
jgi:hypothetical protein